MRNYPTLRTAPSYPPWTVTEHNLLRPRKETESTRQMSCDVVFGSPSANCMGTGVCRISARHGGSISASERKRSCKSTVGLLFPMEGGMGVSMVLTRSLLCTQLYKMHLRRGSLQIDSPCPLPEDLVLALDLKIKEIPLGNFQIQESNGFLRIDFIGLAP